ncbi:mannosyltransferase [Mitosporidium daphniae]
MSSNILYIVIGDVGHSPRTLLHVEESLKLKSANKVGCLALLESSIPNTIQTDKKFCFYDLKSLNIAKGSVFYPIFAAFKFVLLSVYILWFLLWESPISWDVVVCQNPPGVPLFLLLFFSKFVCRNPFRWIIDWHNLGYSLLPHRNAMLRAIYKYIELRIGIFADCHLTVTQGLKDYLVQQGFPRHARVSSIFVARDYPRTPIPAPLSRAELEARLSAIEPDFWKSTSVPIREIFSKNPKIILSATSWTPDEDFNTLLQSIDRLEHSNLLSQHLLVVITGKGPLKNAFIRHLESKKSSWKNTTFVLGWFSLLDYYSLLSAADLGISFHVSSSGLDFPMKIIDMVSCNTPQIAALEFQCLKEGISSLHTNTKLLAFSNEDTLTNIICSISKSASYIPQVNPRSLSFSSHWRGYMNAVFPDALKTN